VHSESIKIDFILLFYWLNYAYIMKFFPTYIKCSVCSERKVGDYLFTDLLVLCVYMIFARWICVANDDIDSLTVSNLRTVGLCTESGFFTFISLLANLSEFLAVRFSRQKLIIAHLVSIFNLCVIRANETQPTASHSIPLRFCFILSSHLRLGLPTVLFRSDFPTKLLHELLLSDYFINIINDH
jgi:hypothetical protein